MLYPKMVGVRTSSLVSLIPKVAHSVVHFLHLQRVIFHDGADFI